MRALYCRRCPSLFGQLWPCPAGPCPDTRKRTENQFRTISRTNSVRSGLRTNNARWRLEFPNRSKAVAEKQLKHTSLCLRAVGTTDVYRRGSDAEDARANTLNETTCTTKSANGNLVFYPGSRQVLQISTR